MAVTAFLSYSWERDEDHRRWVRDLAARLRADGIDTRLDQWHAVPGDQLPAFMERAIRENDFVLVICTPEYKRKSDARAGGVGYEGDVMTAEAAVTGNQRKFIPLLRKGEWTSSAPSWMLGKYYIDMRSDPMPASSYDDLLQTLRGTRPAAPPLGPGAGGAADSAASACEQRLAETLALADATQWLGNVLNLGSGWTAYSSRERRLRLDIARTALDRAAVGLAAYRACQDPRGLEIAGELLTALKRLVRIVDGVVPPLHERRDQTAVDELAQAEWRAARAEAEGLLPASGRKDTPAGALLASRPNLHAAFAALREDTQALYRLYGFADRQAYLDVVDPPTRVVLAASAGDAQEIIGRVLAVEAVTDVELMETGIPWASIDATLNALLKDTYVSCDYGTPATLRVTELGRRALPNLLKRAAR